MKLITPAQLNQFRRAKAIFEKSRHSLGYRELRKRLCKEGFNVSDYCVQKIVVTLGLAVTRRVACKVTTKRKHSDAVADNLHNHNCNPVAPNQVWAGLVFHCDRGSQYTRKHYRKLLVSFGMRASMGDVGAG